MRGKEIITHQRQLSSYHRLVRRINHTITTPRAQRERQANLYPSQSDRPEDWERLLDEIQQADGVALMKRPDGSVYVTWRQADI
ncbi:DUF1654 domain-containing protein [Stutzerimonas frequens]|uniref:DUF1654 domain-containing protein n=1 Tax=Stutzerimonas frequens TaxID=2968969 RepID=UPI0025555B61|nr:DUF1654 domain-containing protein [Stutzerimonas frequens]MDL0441861.1 DUF1654 domain-containing protein [Stutzerimonas frequens]